jgi:Mn2+/Fe2+ NRAMP family transporter
MKSIRKLRLGIGIRQLGPGLITGAADDDPSGIATYSQAGAQFGYWLTLALLSYVAVVFTAHVDWRLVVAEIFRPHLQANHEMLLMVVAVFGTTISPYLFFWQAAQEMEDNSGSGEHTPREVRRHLRRIKFDTIIGMTFSNLIAFFIILSTAATLHAAGVTDIQTSSQAAEALRPLAVEFTFMAA